MNAEGTTPAWAQKVRPPADPEPGRARRSLDHLLRAVARPYRAASRVASRLRAVGVGVAAVIAPGSEVVAVAAMLSRLVLLKERHEEALRADRGADAVEWMAIDARAKAVQGTPVDRISPVEMDALMTALDGWTRRCAR